MTGRKLRILYSHRVQSKDGQGVHIEELIRAFREAGHEVLVIGPSFYETSEFGGESKMVAVLRRLLPGVAAELAELVYNIPAYRRLKKAHDAFRPDFIYERCNLFFLAGTWLTRRTGTRLFLEVNSPLAEERAKHGGLILKKLALRLEHSTWRAAARVFPVTGVLADMLHSAGVARDRITIMPNGVDLARFPARSPKPQDAPIELGFVGFVRPWHGLDRIIAGMASLATPMVLTIVGDGPVRAALEQQAERLGLAEKIRFTGVVPPENVPAIVAGFDIALQPMATPYASPLKIFDYMAAGCAIVAPAQPNIEEVLTHDETALLFDPANLHAMWQAIQALAGSADLRYRLGYRARAKLEGEAWTWAGNAARIAALGG